MNKLELKVNNQVGKEKVSDLLPSLKLIAFQTGLTLNEPRQFNICRDIYVKSITQN